MARSIRPSFVLVGCVLTPVALAAEDPVFTPNHLFVTDWANDRVVEFDRQGAFVREFGNALLDGPEGLAFGPDGNLYVVSSMAGKIVVLDPAGEFVDEITHADLQRPIGITFGPFGNLLVTDGLLSHVVEFDSARDFVRTIDHGSFGYLGQVRYGPDGHFFVADGAYAGLREFDPSGVLVRDLPNASIGSAAGVAFGPAGLLRTSDAFLDKIVAFEHDGDATIDTTGAALDGPYQICGGPDYSCYVACVGTARVVSFLGTVVQREIGADAGLNGPGAVAFAPFRIPVRVKGKVSGGEELHDLNQKAILWLAPGSYQIMLQFLTDGQGGNGYASIFGSEYAVFHGLEGVTAADQESRLFQGREVPGPAMNRGSSSIALKVGGKIQGDENYFVPKTVSGTLDRAVSYFQLQAKITTPK